MWRPQNRWGAIGLPLVLGAAMLCAALIVAEVVLVLALDRMKLLRAGPKKLDGPTARVQ